MVPPDFLVADDLDGGLVGAYGTVGAKAPEFAADGSFRSGMDLFGLRQGSMGHIIRNADGEVVLGLCLFQIAEYGKDLGRRGVLGTQSVTSADNNRFPVLFIEYMENILVQGFAQGTGLFCPVEHSDLLHRGRQHLQKMLCGERPVKAYTDGADLFPLADQIIHRLIDGVAYGSHGYDDILRIGSAVIVEQMIFPSGDPGDLLHVLGYDLRNGFKILVGGLSALEVDIRVLSGPSYHGMVGVDRPVAELLDSLVIDQRLYVFIIDGFNLLDLMGCPESIKEMKERHSGLDGGQMSNGRQIHGFLHAGGCQHGKSRLSAGHNILMVAEDGKSMGG